MPGFKASVDVSNLMRRMSQYSNQFPFAVASALTKTAKDSQPVVRAKMEQVFDRPTNYTLNSTYVKPARKSDPEPSAEVYFKDEAFKGTPAAKYIFPEVYGGQRNVKRYERALAAAHILPAGMITVPGKGVTLDRYGNIPAGLINAMLSQLGANPDAYQNATGSKRSRRTRKVRGQFFVGRPGGGRLPSGVWLRTSTGLKSFLIFVKKATYTKRLPFEQTVEQVFNERIYANFDAALARAIATAR